jgi:membrane-bound inhibitor of C-type lysozyme
MKRSIRPHSTGTVIFLVLGALAMILTIQGSDLRAAKPEDLDKAPTTKKFHYLCEDGKSFTLELNTKEDCVLLTLEDKPIKLPRVVSGSGARYSNGRTTVWLKGQEAFIEMDGKMIIKNCRSQD